MAKINVNINPKVLLWARQEAGYHVEEVAVKLSVESNRYLNWEKEGKEIPFGKLQNLATYYKRQLAVFFLPEVPVKIKKPKDFRNLSPAESFLSKEILLTLRRSIHLQRIAIEEKLGILIFQFSMPMDELQGFCMTDRLPYIIVTNSNHSYTGRVFTLFHELAHIIRHQSSMCLVDNVEQNQKEEWACNTFAGNLLAPVNTLVSTDDLMDITTYARNLKISQEVYLRRLKEEGMLPDVKFYTLLDEINATYKKAKPQKKSFVLPEVKSKASRGETFYNIIFEAIGTNRINYTDAAHALGLRVNRLINEI